MNPVSELKRAVGEIVECEYQDVGCKCLGELGVMKNGWHQAYCCKTHFDCFRLVNTHLHLRWKRLARKVA